MATAYGAQFEALMAEVCRDFGYKLVKSWEADRGVPLDKAELREFVSEAVATFFSLEPKEEPQEEEEVVEKPKKAKAKAKGKALEVEVVVEKPKKAKAKGLAKKSPEPVMDEETEPDVSVKKAPAKKGKAAASTKKPKCQAVTAKGTPCSKCAVDGEPFCNIHMKKAPVESTKPVAKASVEKPKGKGGKGLTKASPPKHTHGLTSPPLKENPCDLCETHGMPFEVPEYEEELAYDPTDPEFVLTEDVFDESDSDMSDLD